jgi:hypothetical protein
MRISLSLYHLNVLFSIFLLDLQTPALLLSIARGLHANIFQWMFLYDAFLSFGWMKDPSTYDSSQNTEYLLNEHDVSPTLTSMGYSSVYMLKNLGFVNWLWVILMSFMLMSRACNFKGSQATIHKNVLSMGEF